MEWGIASRSIDLKSTGRCPHHESAESQFDDVSDFDEKTETHTDPRGEIRYEIAGSKDGHFVDYDPTALHDSDQDGFFDRTEYREIPTDIEGEYARIETDPWEPDTDDDGYWDDWIGVYDVSYTDRRGIDYTDNVILYREHLLSGDGITSDEIVQEQIGVHEIGTAPPGGGVDLDGDGIREHSNVHVGEMQWQADPVGGSTPSVGFSVEADFLGGRPNAMLNSRTWEEDIEDDFALYGIPVDIVRDDTISGIFTGLASANDENLDLLRLVSGSPPITKGCAEFLTKKICTPELIPGKIRNSPAFNMEATTDTWPLLYELPDNGILMYGSKIATDAESFVSNGIRRESQYSTKDTLLATFVTMHELGHSLNVGRDDDDGALLPLSEVYSGSDKDDTPEQVNVRGIDSDRWSIMRKGWSSDALIPYDKHGFFGFSIEELLTIRQVRG